MTDKPKPSIRDLERALIAAGLSRREAKSLLAKGYKAAFPNAIVWPWWKL